MSLTQQIDEYLAGLPEPKREELQELHRYMLQTYPECDLWFNDGRSDEGKVVTNPSIGYGRYTITYADRTEKDFYRIGLSANTAGISVYVMGLKDKTALRTLFADSLGKAKVTGYCIKFRRIADIDRDTLHAAIRYGMSGGDGT